MKTSVGHIRSVISGLRPDTEIEIKNNKISILPRRPIIGLNANCRIDLDQCVQMKKDGKSFAEIGRHFGVTRQAVYDFLKKLRNGPIVLILFLCEFIWALAL